MVGVVCYGFRTSRDALKTNTGRGNKSAEADVIISSYAFYSFSAIFSERLVKPSRC